jgi:hypothetical protein
LGERERGRESVGGGGEKSEPEETDGAKLS